MGNEATNPSQSTPESVQPLNPEDQKIADEFGRRFLNGDKLKDIFGIEESYIRNVEQMAYQLYVNGDYAKARMLAEGVIALDKERYYPFLIVGDIALKAEDLESASSCLYAADRLKPEDPAIECKLGETLVKLGALQNGLEYLRKAQDHSPEGNPYRQRASVLQRIVNHVQSATFGQS